MTDIEQIENAIAVHTSWLKNIRTAILVCSNNSSNSNTTQYTKTITKIGSDDQCVFGKWLYKTIDPSLKDLNDHEIIVVLHKQFHQQAANILSLAYKGKKSQARSLISDDSDFIQCSEKLIEALNKWKKNL